MITDRFGLYVHIPYCVRKCNYCDFCSLPNGRGAVPEDYVEALVREIRSYCKSERMLVDTLYFGGGTPSLLSPEQLGSIMSAIRDGFDISPAAEITFEANPGTLTLERARAFKSCGFNRVSLGLQSIHDKEMKKLGRIHSYDDFLTTYEMLRSEGFANVSVDLMYGIPHQTRESFEQTLRAVVALSPEHISVYGLILEEGTPFFDDEALELPTLDEECDMYDLARSLLAEAGYEHYEISNYARNGYRSRHNSLYWNLGEYVGVGAAAHSFIDSVRYCNTSEVSEYIASASPRSATDDNIDAPFEYAMLKLRMSDGFSLSEYEHRFKRSFTEGKDELLSRLAREGLVILDGDRIALTERGFYLSNSILVEIL